MTGNLYLKGRTSVLGALQARATKISFLSAIAAKPCNYPNLYVAVEIRRCQG